VAAEEGRGKERITGGEYDRRTLYVHIKIA
jgi:hypothetical protein